MTSSTHVASAGRDPVGRFAMVAALLLGILVAVLGFFALMMWADARESRDQPLRRACTAARTTHRPQHGAAAEQLRRRRAGERHRARRRAQALRRDAAAFCSRRSREGADDPEGHLIEVAPGVKYNTWAFDGHGAPARSCTSRGTDRRDDAQERWRDPALDRLPRGPDRAERAFKDVAPGESFTFRFKASDPGVFMYHCGTKPVLAHIANGMYGAIVVTGQGCRRSTTSTSSSPASGT